MKVETHRSEKQNLAVSIVSNSSLELVSTTLGTAFESERKMKMDWIGKQHKARVDALSVNKHTQKVIAYGNGGETQDRDRRNVVHAACWPHWNRIGPYVRSLDSVYFDGAQDHQLKGRTCAKCGQGF